ncbi:hypothetical protein [Nocardiopsis sp. FR4]|uniref:hypothetical protein n=1 Tax=Nocardiopsis sp. FR4 TaxID=2605985 RepID=UPI00135B77AB|nr:hypothetical protein [Nocardiopsis sp. FR4]
MDRDADPHQLDHPLLHDHVALDEIELYAEVLIAVADADRPLSPAEIDRVLGVSPRPARQGARGPETGRPPGPERPPGPPGPTGPPPRTPERGPDPRPPEPREEEPGTRTLPDTGPLSPQARILPEAPPLGDVLPVPLSGPFAAWHQCVPPLTGWPS